MAAAVILARNHFGPLRSTHSIGGETLGRMGILKITSSWITTRRTTCCSAGGCAARPNSAGISPRRAKKVIWREPLLVAGLPASVEWMMNSWGTDETGKIELRKRLALGWT